MRTFIKIIAYIFSVVWIVNGLYEMAHPDENTGIGANKVLVAMTAFVLASTWKKKDNK